MILTALTHAVLLAVVPLLAALVACDLPNLTSPDESEMR